MFRAKVFFVIGAAFCARGAVARSILEVIHAVSNDDSLTPLHNLMHIGRISEGFAPMLTEILEDYL